MVLFLLMGYFFNSCGSLDFYYWPFWVFLIIEIGLFSLISYLVYLSFRKLKEHLFSIIITFFGLCTFVFLSVVFIFSMWFYFLDGDWYGNKYDPLNAAIKNTCYLNPKEGHCPKTVEELIAIEPETFKPLTRGAYLTYKYYPETNEYTLIVRNSTSRQAIIFDPRLLTLSEYGGIDLTIADLATCNGRRDISNPPPFDGPWTNIN